MKTTMYVLFALLAATSALGTVVVNDIGGSCGGMGDQAPKGVAKVDNCWAGYVCGKQGTQDLVCVRNSQWSWNCEVKGSIGPDGKPINANQCHKTDAPNGGRKLISDAEVVAQSPPELVVAEFGSCGGTGAQTPKDRKPVAGCWQNTKCAGEAICIQEDAQQYNYQCLPKGSLNYKGEKVFTDACAP